MSPRLSSSQRRREIVDAALALLATNPIDGITTHDVARRVGVSRPALFRHFRSRDAIFETVVADTRARLEGLIEHVLQPGRPPLDSLEALLRGVIRDAAQHPGTPRLLFYDATGSEAPFRRALRQLISMQRALASELVREAQRRTEVSESIDPESAGRLFVAMIQGALLQWQLFAHDGDLEQQAGALFGVWRAGLAAGEPDRQRTPPARAAATGDAAASALVCLDVRPLLDDGRDPLDHILGQLEQLPAHGVLKVIAPFRPGPLLSLLAWRGYRAVARELEPRVWETEIQPQGAVEIADHRELEAPLPLERILEATPALEPGGVLLARVPRVPSLLFPHLEQRQLTWEVHREPDGSALIRVCKPA